MMKKMMVMGQHKVGGTICMRVARRDHMVTRYTWSQNQMYCNWARGFACLSSALLLALLVSVEAGAPASTCSGIDVVDVKVT
jgi:hypothetical protein